ncbi:MAG TPA: HEAT repeat domain-containing protein [Candidatus Acidoferrales bacterium]|nr:HEAT repeat domain-containing protein [Candidatus Acidoferrales bacterium]
MRPSMWAAAATAGLSVDVKGTTGGAQPPTGVYVPGSTAGATFTIAQEDIRGVLQMLVQLGKTTAQQGGGAEPAMFQQRLTTMPMRAQTLLYNALSGLAAQATTDQPDQPMLLKLAQHISIRFALESYERGEVRVNAVKQMFESLNQEIEALRRVIGAHEERLGQAGVKYESHVQLMTQFFWEEVPEEKKKEVLLTGEAWCVPSRNIRSYVEELKKKGDKETITKILRNYVNCISLQDPEARRETALGLPDVADLLMVETSDLLLESIEIVGKQVAVEEKPELQTLIGAAFVRLSQAAASLHSFPSMIKSLDVVEEIEKARPGSGQNLFSRIGVENRIPEFIEEALRDEAVPEGLSELLKRAPRPAIEHLAGRFSRAGFREDIDLLLRMSRELGESGAAFLRDVLRSGPPPQAVESVGLLARLDPETLELWLPPKIGEWQRSFHDRVIRQIAAADSTHRCRLLLTMFDQLDPLVKPLALDEIGLSGETMAVPMLLELASGNLPAGSAPYLRIKAIEALSRLRAADAIPMLRKVVETRQMFRWSHPAELRIVSLQALEKLDPEFVKGFFPKAGIEAGEFAIATPLEEPTSSVLRQRRYARLKLSRPLPLVTTNLRENQKLETTSMNLGGGIATCERYLTPGTLIQIKFTPTMKSIRATAFVRDSRSQMMGFEVVDIDLEERHKLRRVLADLAGVTPPTSPKSRSRRRDRGVTAGPKTSTT